MADAPAAALGRLRAKSLKAAASARPQRVAVDCRRACGCAYNQGDRDIEARVDSRILINYIIMNYIICMIKTAAAPAHPQQGHQGPDLDSHISINYIIIIYIIL